MQKKWIFLVFFFKSKLCFTLNTSGLILVYQHKKISCLNLFAIFSSFNTLIDTFYKPPAISDIDTLDHLLNKISPSYSAKLCSWMILTGIVQDFLRGPAWSAVIPPVQRMVDIVPLISAHKRSEGLRGWYCPPKTLKYQTSSKAISENHAVLSKKGIFEKIDKKS